MNHLKFRSSLASLLLTFCFPAMALCQDGSSPPPWVIPLVARTLHGPIKVFISMASMASFLTLLVSTCIGVLALSLLAMARAPEEVDKTVFCLEKRPGASVAIGLVNFLLALVLLNVLLRIFKGLGALLALIVLSFMFIRAFRGLAAVGRSLGRRLWERAKGPAPSDVHEALAGLFALCAAAFLPFVGWAFVFWEILRGLGAAVWVTAGRAPAATEAQPMEERVEE